MTVEQRLAAALSALAGLALVVLALGEVTFGMLVDVLLSFP